MELIKKYFPYFTDKQLDQYSQLYDLYLFWNQQINVISRKDTENFYERHVLHSLGLAKVQDFLPGSNILDVGTGGGFPGIPLAIAFPEVEFTLVDSIGKKIKVVNEVAKSLGLNNVTGIHERAEHIQDNFDFIVSRAVTEMPKFVSWMRGKFKAESKHNLANGILYLKGGDLSQEMKDVPYPYHYFPLSDYFEEPFFETKKVVYVDFSKVKV